MSQTPPSPDQPHHAGNTSNTSNEDAPDQQEEQNPVQQRMDHLLDQCVQKAIALIQEHGEYYPFGITLDAKGKLSLTQAKLEEETPSSDAVTEKLIKGLMTEAAQGMYTTVAVVADVRLRQPGTGLFTDAIRVMMEDREAEPIDFFLPYNRQGKKIVTSDIMAQQAPAVIFTA